MLSIDEQQIFDDLYLVDLGVASLDDISDELINQGLVQHAGWYVAKEPVAELTDAGHAELDRLRQKKQDN